MKIKVKPDHFYWEFSTIYVKHGWWPFWRKAGWVPNDKLDRKIEMLRNNEGRM
jgi:hypothetical protein